MIILIILLILAILYGISIKHYFYSNDNAPLTKYKVSINTLTKKMKGEFYHSCSAVNCLNSTKKYSITLTEDEYKKIIKLWKDKETLSQSFEGLCADDKVFYKSFEDSREDSIEDYKKLDLNSDGIITSREFANQMLIDAINEIDK